MLNNFVLVGRIVFIDEINENEALIKIAVSRSFKNENGEYETDFPILKINGNIAKSTMEYCEKGDIIGARGSIRTTDNKVELVADKITFLSSKKQDE